MNSISLRSESKSFLIDLVTPVAAYLKLRDLYAGSVLLESSEYNSLHNSKSIIAINPIYEMVEKDGSLQIIKNRRITHRYLYSKDNLHTLCVDFFSSIKAENDPSFPMNGFLGYQNYKVFSLAEGIVPASKSIIDIPDIRYAVYEFILIFDHFRHRLTIVQNSLEGVTPSAESIDSIYTIVTSAPVSETSIRIAKEEHSDCSKEDYLRIVEAGKAHCRRGDVFQIVLSSAFWRSYEGDEFMLYRALRSINPSPYLFYYDFVAYQLLGSSPESQLVIEDKRAIMRPIAGTYKRTGDIDADYIGAQKLLLDEKENAEHVMLVDLARNDLSKFCANVEVESHKEIQMYSHVIHLVSTVTGTIDKNIHPFTALLSVSPAGTLSGAPKHKAIELIDAYEQSERSFYGGSLGIVCFNNNINQAITIRSCLLKDNVVHYRAGAGITHASVAELEFQEINNKINAIRRCFDTLT